MRRREFVAAVVGAASYGRVLGANERIRVGVIGTGGRGQLLTGVFKEAGAEVMAVCDVYQPHLEGGLKMASAGAKSYTDYRRLLEDKSLDAVVVATPDHWHSRVTIDAVDAGKDVYVEKPLAHTIDEGAAMVRAVRGTKRVVQVGTQRRSNSLFLEAKGIMDSGQIGEVSMVTSEWMNYQTRLADRKLEGPLDWKAWLGSAPARPLDPVRFFNWYHFWDYSGGMLVGQAAHIMDAIQWFMNSREPAAVTCLGGKPRIEGAETPETVALTAEFPGYIATFAITYKAMVYHRTNDQLKQFHGTKARFDVGRERYSVFPQSREVDMKPSAEKRVLGSFEHSNLEHVGNFLECVRSRKDPNAPIEAGQATNVVLCLAMESMKTRRRVEYRG